MNASAIPVTEVVRARSGRWLARALIALFFVHGLAMLSMALFEENPAKYGYPSL